MKNTTRAKLYICLGVIAAILSIPLDLHSHIENAYTRIFPDKLQIRWDEFQEKEKNEKNTLDAADLEELMEEAEQIAADAMEAGDLNIAYQAGERMLNWATLAALLQFPLLEIKNNSDAERNLILQLEAEKYEPALYILEKASKRLNSIKKIMNLTDEEKVKEITRLDKVILFYTRFFENGKKAENYINDFSKADITKEENDALLRLSSKCKADGDMKSAFFYFYLFASRHYDGKTSKTDDPSQRLKLLDKDMGYVEDMLYLASSNENRELLLAYTETLVFDIILTKTKLHYIDFQEWIEIKESAEIDLFEFSEILEKHLRISKEIRDLAICAEENSFFFASYIGYVGSVSICKRTVDFSNRNILDAKFNNPETMEIFRKCAERIIELLDEIEKSFPSIDFSLKQNESVRNDVLVRNATRLFESDISKFLDDNKKTWNNLSRISP